MITTTLRHYTDLSLDTLYDILALRARIFIVEQQCPYLDLDGLDKEALHLLMQDNNTLIGYIRLLPNTLHFGRVLIHPTYRHLGLGTQLIKQAIAYFTKHHRKSYITIEAQFYLLDFYKNLGFDVASEPFLLENIEHITMTYCHE